MIIIITCSRIFPTNYLELGASRVKLRINSIIIFQLLIFNRSYVMQFVIFINILYYEMFLTAFLYVLYII